MPYQKEENFRFMSSSSTDEYNKSGQDGSGNGLGTVILFLLVVALVGGGYLLVNRAGEFEWPTWFSSFDWFSEEEVEPYRYELEIPSDSLFFTLHPKDPNLKPYKKLNYDHFMYYSIQNSARGLNYGAKNGDLALLAFELQQQSRFGYYASVYKEYKQLYNTDFIYDILRMTLPDDMGEAMATPYEVTYLFNVIRRDPKMRHDGRLVTADLMNALNSACLDSIENRVYRRLRGNNVIAVWKNYLYITDFMGRSKNMLQALSESPSLQNGDAATYDRAKKCALQIVDYIVKALSKVNGRTAKNISAFQLAAQKEIESAFVPGASPRDFAATQKALDSCFKGQRGR